MEDAGVDAARLNGSRTGVFVGISSDDYTQAHRHSSNLDIIDGYALTGTCFAPAAGRISYTFGFQGPCLAVDTACSSSLAALHLACQSLRNHESDAALVGGVNLILSPIFHICSTKLGTISPDGRCKTFDASADGYGRGEGCGVVMLKRLSDARRDGDRIMALIRGTALNQDGKSNGLTAPNGLAQEKLIRAALANANLTPADIHYMEAHGTGTPLGDPIEVESIARVMKEGHDAVNPIYLGSVKANIGHLEAAAGISGLIKVIQCMRHRAIPPHLHLNNPSPHIPWDRIPVKVATALTPWEPVDGTLRAGVSSFGFSGTNAHAIVESGDRLPEIVDRKSQSEVDIATTFERPRHALPLSARNPEALKELAQRYAAHLESSEDPLADLAYTAGAGRAHFNCRLVAHGSTSQEVAEALKRFAEGESHPALASGAAEGKARIAFLFTGQGAQYAGMGRALYETQPVFREAVEAADAALREPLGESIVDALYGPDASDERLSQTKYTQAGLFALQYALGTLWMDWGVQPSAAAGHSIGEYAAACLAGVLSLDDAACLVAHRGRLMQSLPAGGAMAAIFTDEAQALHVIAPYGERVSIAAINAPGSVVISGESDAVASCMEALAKQGVESRPLNVSHAFHSALMTPILDEFEAIAMRVAYNAPRIQLVSTLTGLVARSGDMMNPRYWRDQIRNPVRFHQAAETLAAEGVEVFLEIGPAPTLINLASRCLDAGPLFLPSLKPKLDDWGVALSSLAALYAHGEEIDWRAFDAPYSRRKTALPHYPFQRKRYYMNPVITPETVSPVGAYHAHPYIGRRIKSPLLNESTALYEAYFTADRPAFLRQHVIFGKIISPAAAHVSMGLSATGAHLEHQAIQLEDVSFTAPLVVEEEGARTVQVIVEEANSGRPAFRLVSRDAHDDRAKWVTHCAGRATRIDLSSSNGSVLDIRAIEQRCAGTMSSDEFYQYIESAGYSTGPHFQCIRRIHMGENEALCRVHPPFSVDDGAIHPGLIDSLLQTVLPACRTTAAAMLDGDNILIPLHMGAVRKRRSPVGELICHTRVQAQGDVIKSRIDVYNEAGEALFEIEDFLLKQTTRAVLYREMGGEARLPLFITEWRELPAEASIDAPASRGATLILADALGYGEALAAELERRGEPYTIAQPGERYERLVDSRVVIDPDSAEDTLRLLNECVPSGASVPTQIVYLRSLDGTEPETLDAVALLDRERRLCEPVLRILHALDRLGRNDKARLWLVTHRSQSAQNERALSPISASLWGLGRALAVERPESWGGLIDVDGDASTVSIRTLLTLLQKPNGEDQLALRRGEAFAARLVKRPSKADESKRGEQLDIPKIKESESYYLDTTTRGSLNNLIFKTRARQAPQAGEVEVEIYAAGLNFRDVLNALGQYPGDAGLMGYEAAGVVATVGAGVDNAQPGDRVFVLGAPGCIGSHVTIRAEFAIKMPERMTFEEAITIPATFLTAYYALHELGGLRKGERILIHAGAGGVGMAAVQLALNAGAEVFATAGSPEKREFLEKMGVQHVMNSRTLEFADEIKAITQGRGVDLVLNSLNGEFIAKSFSVLAPQGRFLEMGKIGIWTEEQARAADPSYRYYPFDLAAVSRDNPALIAHMFDALMADFESGALRPLPLAVFAMRNAVEAYRYMAQAKHIGKIALSRREEIFREFAERDGAIRADGTYLITGGLGALGLLFARWLVEQGARSVALTGRNAPKPAAQAVLDELRGLGACVDVLQGDISKPEDVERILAAIRRQAPPLRGIIHAAGLLDDGMLAEQSWERFSNVMAPKVQGAWNLHRATRGEPLDFFVLFSSVAAIIGNLGQGNYASANAFLDGLAHYRRRIGLPASSINWGPWAEAGMAADVRNERFSAMGIRYIKPEDGIRAFASVLGGGDAQPCVFEVDWQTYGRSQGIGGKSGLYAELIGGGASSSQPTAASTQAEPKRDILDDLRDALPTQRRVAALDYVQRLAQNVLGYGESERLAPDQPLANQGFDSLMTVDMRNRLGKDFGRTLPASLLFDYPTLDKLAAYLLDEFLGEEPEADKAGVRAASDSADSVLQEIDDLLKS